MERTKFTRLLCFFLWLSYTITKRLILLIDQFISQDFKFDYCCECRQEFLICAESLKNVSAFSSLSSAAASMTVIPTGAQNGPRQDFDSVTIESCGMSPLALQNIREQMALSLERTKQLEDQVKLLPELKVSHNHNFYRHIIVSVWSNFVL